MGSRGDCFDNAVAESFCATLKTVHPRPHLAVQGRTAHRGLLQSPPRHSTLGMLSSADYEHPTLARCGTGLAVPRLASTHKIKFTAPTPRATPHHPWHRA